MKWNENGLPNGIKMDFLVFMKKLHKLKAKENLKIQIIKTI